MENVYHWILGWEEKPLCNPAVGNCMAFQPTCPNTLQQQRRLNCNVGLRGAAETGSLA